MKNKVIRNINHSLQLISFTNLLVLFYALLSGMPMFTSTFKIHPW